MGGVDVGRPEDSRVKIPALVHFTRLGYSYMSIKNKQVGIDYDGDTNIFYGLFQESINRINGTTLSLEDVKKIIAEIKIKLSNDDLGKAFFTMLQEGYEGLKFIDFSTAFNADKQDKNSYTVVTELPCENGEDSFRPDITVLINGMPLSFVEVKRQNNKEGIQAEHERMTRRFSNPAYKRFVNITQFTVFSNNNEYDDTSVHWSVPYYNAAVQSGVIKASDFECTPGALNSSLSREDMALILVNAAKVNGESMQTLAGVENMMKDYNSISYDRRDAVMKAYSNGLLAGDTVGKFNPHNTMTRAQMATVVCRLMEYAPRGSVSVPVKVDVNEYVSNEGDTKGMLLPKFSREYETKALQAVRTGEDSKGVYVTFTAPELPTEIKGNFTYNFSADMTKSNGDYFTDILRVSLKSGESKKLYFVSYQDTGVKSNQIGLMSVGVYITNSAGKSMFVRHIDTSDKTTAYGTWHNGLSDNIALDSSAVWAGIGK